MINTETVTSPTEYIVETCDICGKEIKKYKAGHIRTPDQLYTFDLLVDIITINMKSSKKSSIKYGCGICKECSYKLHPLLKSAITDTMNKVMDDFKNQYKEEKNESDKQ